MTGFKIVFGLLAWVLLVSALETDVDGDNYIIGGNYADPHRFPWMVSLRNRQNIHFCGGFVLSDRWVGSAAHCTQGNRANHQNVLMAFGAHRRADGNRQRVVQIVNHPRFNRRTLNFDVSVLRAVGRIFLSPQVRAIRFPSGPAVPEGSAVFFAGWGRTQYPAPHHQGFPTILQWKQTRIIGNAECKQRIGSIGSRLIHPENICTLSSTGRGACLEDYGGPLFDQHGTCFGIASWNNCATRFPDIYVKLWTVIPFIRQAIQNNIPNLPQSSQ